MITDAQIETMERLTERYDFMVATPVAGRVWAAQGDDDEPYIVWPDGTARDRDEMLAVADMLRGVDRTTSAAMTELIAAADTALETALEGYDEEGR